MTVAHLTVDITPYIGENSARAVIDAGQCFSEIISIGNRGYYAHIREDDGGLRVTIRKSSRTAYARFIAKDIPDLLRHLRTINQRLQGRPRGQDDEDT